MKISTRSSLVLLTNPSKLGISSLTGVSSLVSYSMDTSFPETSIREMTRKSLSS